MPKLDGNGLLYRAVDSDALPVSGAFLYVYLAGTTTPVTTYSDEALSVPHASPIVANAAGAFPAVYVPEGSYKIDMTGTDNVSLEGYPSDNIEIASVDLTSINDAIGKAAFYRDQAIAASEASGNVLFYDTKALADGAVSGLTEDQIVEVLTDETRDSLRARYRVESGALVHKVTIGSKENFLSEGGATDANFSALLAVFDTVVIDIDYTLSSEISVPDGRKIVIKKGVTVSKLSGDFFNPQGSIELEHNGIMAGDDDSSIIKYRMGVATGINVHGSGEVQESAICEVDLNGYTFGTLTDSELLDEIIVKDIRMTCTTGAGTRPAVQAFYFQYCYVNGTKIDGYRHGITLWGGNASTDTFDFTTAKKAFDAIVTENVVTNCGTTDTGVQGKGGGIWAASVNRVIFANNIIDTGTDVGLDFEGCVYAVASDNVVRDFDNGCLSTFYACQDVKFTGNMVEQRMGFPVNRTYNSSADATQQRSVEISNNTFAAYNAGGATEYATSDANNGVIDGWVEENNTYRNVIIIRNNASGFHGETKIKGNTFYFSETIADPFRVIEVARMVRGSLTIAENNVHVLEGTIPDNSTFIHVENSTNTRRIPIYLYGNISNTVVDAQEFDLGIVVEDSGTNSGNPPRAFFRDNIVNAITLSTTRTGTTATQILKQDSENYDSNGNAITVTV